MQRSAWLRNVVVCLFAVGVPIASMAPAAATFAGGNGEIVYTRWVPRPSGSSDVTTRAVLPDGTQRRTVVADFTEDAAYSADGSTLAYIVERGVGYVLFLEDVDTGDRTRVVTGDDFPPKVQVLDSVAFSPTGDRLVVGTLEWRRGTFGRLWTLDLDGTNVELISGDRSLIDADWSAADRLVAEIGTRRLSKRTRLLTLDPDGSNLERLVALPPSVNTRASTFAWPSWSPDGGTVAFASQSGRGRSDIWLVDVDGSNVRRFTDTRRRWESSPVWAPDGSALVVSRTDRQATPRTADLWVMRISGGRTRLTASPGGSEFASGWQAV